MRRCRELFLSHIDTCSSRLSPDRDRRVAPSQPSQNTRTDFFSVAKLHNIFIGITAVYRVFRWLDPGRRGVLIKYCSGRRNGLLSSRELFFLCVFLGPGGHGTGSSKEGAVPRDSG